MFADSSLMAVFPSALTDSTALRQPEPEPRTVFGCESANCATFCSYARGQLLCETLRENVQWAVLPIHMLSPAA
ncbi:uncharacterized protein MONOS_8552 [Monocercomonoides exilis]|uniref:uncharacterized protein n=1 Tax=Monocercomonoides exilis TaxID=2049356 RepID=UPI00355A0EA5|nr:hypothetical protein MONOS_8552 [Monocercomonoides exilis]|eukprot:MONOS_8552.1-p1 / transcript=MONOS_8552.1 / gene=MONOS_8552 / organism=Monocercomonoides_exilis_PA203 / gene_product=unspecified product / transcript_product=unspecified product / location=Mono_scaffold00325:24351-24572(-) / protein_length=74 / sequence_SO=supercontig / SO=protein_coding / is_pseudo=false